MTVAGDIIDWDGPSRQSCPDCGRGPKDRTCGVTIDDRGGVAHCHRCGYVETKKSGGLSGFVGGRATRPPTRVSRHETLSDFGRQLWDACRPLEGDGRAYLEARACVISPSDGDLRYHPALKHAPSGTIGPALVALVTDAVSGLPLTLHRTWVRADGTKAPVDPPRMLLGGHRKAGGVVRLWPDEAVNTGLGIAEGIETALSVAHAYQPVWACIDAGNMATLPPLDGIESLTIAADNDGAGIAATETCGAHWSEVGREVRVVMPDTSKADMNDIARAAA